MKLAVSIVALILMSDVAVAQVRQRASGADPRVQIVDYAADQVVQLSGSPNYVTAIQFAPDEQIETVSVGEGSSWQASANHRGDHLFVRAQPGAVATNMTVVTNQRLYSFDLLPASGAGEMAYTLRFRFPGTNVADEAVNTTPDFAAGSWRVSGARALRPARVEDDGTHIYLQWPRDRSLPAIYAVDERGNEMLVNGAMRDDVFVIDGVVRALVFRVDRSMARAVRVAARVRR